MNLLYGRPYLKPNRRTVRKPGPFGKGIFPPVRPFEPSRSDRIELAMGTVSAKPLNWIDAMLSQIKTDLARLDALGRDQDALLSSLHIKPIRGGAPVATRFIPTPQDLDDVFGTPSCGDDAQFMNAAG